MDSRKLSHRAAGAGTLLLLALPVAVALFSGCADTGNPEKPVALTPSDDGTFEVTLPPPAVLLPTPEHAAVSYLGAGAVSLTWDSQGHTFDTVVRRDGVEVGRVNALVGEFVDHVKPKTADVLSYTISYSRGLRLGHPAELSIKIPRPDAASQGSPTPDGNDD